jgi:hypothetical protein
MAGSTPGNSRGILCIGRTNTPVNGVRQSRFGKDDEGMAAQVLGRLLGRIPA